jgi:hypothetical protein
MRNILLRHDVAKLDDRMAHCEHQATMCPGGASLRDDRFDRRGALRHDLLRHSQHLPALP